MEFGLEYGSPEWFACKTGLALYLHKLDGDAKVFAGSSILEKTQHDREAETILLDHVENQRAVVHRALVLLEAMR